MDALNVPIGFLIDLSASKERDELFQAFARWSAVIMNSDRATVAVWNGADGLDILAIEGNQAIATGATMPVEGSLIGRVFKSKTSEICTDFTAEPHLAEFPRLAAAGLRAVIDVPLVVGDRCFGALAAGYVAPADATSDRRLILESIAGCLASYMLMHEQLQKLSEQSIRDALTVLQSAPLRIVSPSGVGRLGNLANPLLTRHRRPRSLQTDQ